MSDIGGKKNSTMYYENRIVKLAEPRAISAANPHFLNCFPLGKEKGNLNKRFSSSPRELVIFFKRHNSFSSAVRVNPIY